jgi:leader peptidase (prepilin peptidase)/N-methyltransferase
MREMITYLFIGLLGWVSSTALNYLADTLPQHRRLTQPFCRRCQNKLPLLRYILLPGRCPTCGYRYGLRTWLVHITLIMSFVSIWLNEPARLGIIGGWFWLTYFLLVIVIDIEHHLILHTVSAVGAGFAILTGVWIHGWQSTLAGGVAGFLIMLAFYLLGIAYARWSARRHDAPVAEGEALGFGDVNLSGVIGLLLGWPGIIAGLMAAILLAGAVGLLAFAIALLRRRYDPNLALPYGPFLAVAAILLLYLR